LSNFDGNLIVMFGDTPFISYETLIKIKAKCEQIDLVVLGFRTEESAGYGRLVTNSSELLKIVGAQRCKR
jgi:bifunctional UDP-N-acetylglucosamine pyrophosphorylase/glucosamine-1-phosphate N-acetyltransferase